MRMSTKGRFAVNALIDLALRQAGGPVALASIAARQQVSLSYLEQMFSRLRQQGIVESTRGPGGGYTLRRDPAEITVADIVCTVDEGEVEPAEAQGLSRGLWQKLNAAMVAHMAAITLQDLLDEVPAESTPEPARPVRRAFSAAPVLRPVRTTAPNSVFAFGRSFA